MNTLPGSWTKPSRVGNLLSAAKMPFWRVDDMRRLMLAFSFLRGDSKCAANSLFETIQLPSLRSFSFDERSASEQHDSVRRYLIGLWKGSFKCRWGEWLFAEDDSTVGDDEPRTFVHGDLRRRISPPPSSAAVFGQRIDKRCAFCTSKHHKVLPSSGPKHSKLKMATMSSR